MESLFENRHIADKQMLKDLYRYVFFLRKPVIVCYAVLFFCLIVDVIQWIYAKNSFALTGMVFLVPLFFLFMILRYNHVVNTTIKRNIELHGKEVSVKTDVYNDFFQITSSTGSVYKIDFYNIEKVMQTKKLILLMSKEKQIFVLSKDGFTKGTPHEFLAFLKRKGYRI